MTSVVGTAAGQTDSPDAGECEFPYQTTGLYGQTVVEEEPETIVTGAPSVTQTVWEMGAQDKVVAVSDRNFLQYLDGINDYPNLGTSFLQFNPDFPERVATANDGGPPDLLVGALNVPGFKEAFEPFEDDFEYHWFEASGGFEGIQETTLDIGRLIGECEAAEEVVSEMQREIGEVEQAVDGEERPSVLYSIPTTDFSYVPGNGTFIDDIITTAGGRNMYAENGIEGFPQIEDEKAVEIVGQNPDWIVLPGGSPEDVPETELYNNTTAVQKNQILVVNPNLVQQEGPRVTQPLRRMAGSFHPDSLIGVPDRGNSGSGGGQGIPRRLRDESPGEFTGQRSVVENTTVFMFDAGPIDALEFDAVVEGSVTVTSANLSGLPATPIRHFSIQTPEGASGTKTTVRVRVKSSALEEADVPVGDLRVVRLGDVGWEALETTVLETEEGATLVSETEGAGTEFGVVASTPPTIAFDVLDSEDGTLTLDASSSSDEYGEITSYDWTADGEDYEGETVELTVQDGEEREVTLSVTNDVGLTNSTTATVSDGNATEESETQPDDTEENGTETEDGDGTPEDGGSDGGEEDGGGEGLPGFTAVTALVSLLAVVTFSRRRR